MPARSACPPPTAAVCPVGSRTRAPAPAPDRANPPAAVAVAWRAALLLPLLLLARGDVVVSHLPWHGVQVQLLSADPWLAIWLTPHVAVHLVLYDDVILAAIATGMALLWVLMRTPAPAPAQAPAPARRRRAGGLPLLLALVGPGAACG